MFVESNFARFAGPTVSRHIPQPRLNVARLEIELDWKHIDMLRLKKFAYAEITCLARHVPVGSDRNIIVMIAEYLMHI